MAGHNGIDSRGGNDLFQKVDRIDRGFASMKGDLSEIAKNTGGAADFFKQDGDSNIALSKRAAGKSQVSLSAFLLILTLFGVFAIVVVVCESKLDIKISASGIEITQRGADAAGLRYSAEGDLPRPQGIGYLSQTATHSAISSRMAGWK